jgi:PAS domain S-box-containing protein
MFDKRRVFMEEKEHLEKEISSLKKELALYKRMAAAIPFSFTYRDSASGMQIRKEEGHEALVLEDSTPSDGKSGWGMSPEKDPFEKTEAFLSSILDLVPHHIVFIDDKGMITSCNVQAAKDLGVKREQVVGRHIRELLRIPDQKIVLLESLATEQEIINREVLDRNYGIINTRIIRDENGSIKRVMGTFQFLNAIREAEKQALAGRIAAGIAHEIRNPLTTVRGYLQLLESTMDPETSRLFSSLLIPEIDRANKIITDFLQIAKPAEVAAEPLSIRYFIEDYLGKFLYSEALLYNVQMEYEMSEEAALCWIEGNRDELLQVFINLFQNSLQAKSDRPLMVTIKAEAEESHVSLVFQDNGEGISDSVLNYIFDPFFSTKDEGTGLGLSISRKIIENHGGTMTVKSGTSGTAFSIRLPVLFPGKRDNA